MDQLCLVGMRDLVFRRLAIEEGLDVSEGRSRMAFEVAADVDKEEVVINKLPSDDGWRVHVHV